MLRPLSICMIRYKEEEAPDNCMIRYKETEAYTLAGWYNYMIRYKK